jgi:hypothetical protein
MKGEWLLPLPFFMAVAAPFFHVDAVLIVTRFLTPTKSSSRIAPERLALG